MKIDLHLACDDLAGIVEEVGRCEEAGADGLWSTETNRDPFLPLALVAEHSVRMTVGTAVAVAFARSPMDTAYSAWGLQRLSGGRLVLGLGTQVRAHVERRFSMPYSEPARRMREYVAALHAIWDCWEHGTPLAFEGEFYRHTLMSPMFTPRPLVTPRPVVHLAAVGPAMTRTAGAVADGLILHSFTTPGYVRAVTQPMVAAGLDEASRPRDACPLTLTGLVAVGSTDQARDHAVQESRRQIAFYASTPAYRAVLQHHGLGDLGEELHRLSTAERPDRWKIMRDLIDDEVLDLFAIVGTPRDAARQLEERWGRLVSRIQIYAPYEIDPEDRLALVRELSSARDGQAHSSGTPINTSPKDGCAPATRFASPH